MTPESELEKHINNEKSPEKKNSMESILDLKSIKIEFNNSEEFRRYQENLQEDFHKKSPEEQKKIMDYLSQEMGNLYNQLDNTNEIDQKKEIQDKIQKVRFLLSTFHLVYNKH